MRDDNTRQCLSRRSFVRHLRNSPFYAYGAFLLNQSRLSLSNGSPFASTPLMAAAPAPAEKGIGDPADALNVFDFIPVAQRKLSAPHWAYLMTGVDDNRTRDANQKGFSYFQIRARRFVDVTTIDTSVEILGQRLSSPVLLAPAGTQRAFHEEGELAVARAAHVMGHQMILSTLSSYGVAAVAKEYNKPLWFQLYPSSEWHVTKHLIEQAEDAGCPVLVVTVDVPVFPNRESVQRVGRQDRPECSVCHAPEVRDFTSRYATFSGIELSPAQIRNYIRPVTWDLIDRIRQATKMKLVVKGVMTPEDAELCVQNGLDGIIVSNHGGRSLESLMSSIEALPGIVQVVNRKIPVLIDGGFRRGTDVFKALAIGADAICIGRPYLWGLGAFGRQGVQRILELVQAELVLAMQLAGTTSVDKITPAFVRRP